MCKKPPFSTGVASPQNDSRETNLDRFELASRAAGQNGNAAVPDAAENPDRLPSHRETTGAELASGPTGRCIVDRAPDNSVIALSCSPDAPFALTSFGNARCAGTCGSHKPQCRS